jgi:hypothetical protein
MKLLSWFILWIQIIETKLGANYSIDSELGIQELAADTTDKISFLGLKTMPL